MLHAIDFAHRGRARIRGIQSTLGPEHATDRIGDHRRRRRIRQLHPEEARQLRQVRVVVEQAQRVPGQADRIAQPRVRRVAAAAAGPVGAGEVPAAREDAVAEEDAVAGLVAGAQLDVALVHGDHVVAEDPAPRTHAECGRGGPRVGVAVQVQAVQLDRAARRVDAQRAHVRPQPALVAEGVAVVAGRRAAQARLQRHVALGRAQLDPAGGHHSAQREGAGSRDPDDRVQRIGSRAQRGVGLGRVAAGRRHAGRDGTPRGRHRQRGALGDHIAVQPHIAAGKQRHRGAGAARAQPGRADG